MDEVFYNKVKKLAEVKYGLSEDVVEAYEEKIEEWSVDFTPRKVVEILAESVFFDLKV